MNKNSHKIMCINLLKPKYSLRAHKKLKNFIYYSMVIKTIFIFHVDKKTLRYFN